MPKPRYTKSGARIMTGDDLRQGFMNLIERLDSTTAWLMDLNQSMDEQPDNYLAIDPWEVEEMVKDNLALLEQFKKRETKQ